MAAQEGADVGERETGATRDSDQAAVEAAGSLPHETYLGEAMEFFLWSKGAGGRSGKTLTDYRTKLKAFQRWAAGEEGDVPLFRIDADRLESYLIHLKERGVPRADGAESKPLSDSSRKAHLAVLRSFFAHRAARFGGANPAAALNDVRFRRRAPKRTHLTEREAGRLLAAVEREAKEAKAAGAAAKDARARRASEARRIRALRDHAAISAMLYAGLRIEEAAGLFECLQSPPTRSGHPVWFLVIEDEGGLLQATIFRFVYERYGHLLHREDALILEGRAEHDPRRGFSFLVERVGGLRSALARSAATRGNPADRLPQAAPERGDRRAV